MGGDRNPEKLRFTVHSCTGEDPEYPVRELLYHSPQARGWQSARFCAYPQEITLRLEKPSKVWQLQILSHEFKVATRIEVHVGSVPETGPSGDQILWRRLGGLSLDNNERSNFQARELKNVQLHADAVYLRLVIHRCHVNKLNIYNQVGFIALNLVGIPLEPSASTEVQYVASLPPAGVEGYYKTPAAQAATASVDLVLDMNIDPQTAAKIKELNSKKALAVEREDYDEAKSLKNAIERLKAVGAKVAQLEARKRAAVDNEDYDTAKALKADIDKLRNATEGTNPRPGKGLGITARSLDDVPVGRPSQTDPAEAPAAALTEAVVPAEDLPPLPGCDRDEGMGMDLNRTPSQAYDDRRAQGRGSYVADGGSMDQGQASLAWLSIQTAAAPNTAGPAPPEFPPDLPPPEPLSAAQRKEAEVLINFLGDYVIAALYSRVWQLREAALHHICMALREEKWQDQDPREVVREVGRLVVRLSNDKVPNIFQASLQLLRALLSVNVHGAHQRDIGQLMTDIVPILVDKAGDANVRMHSAAVDMLLHLADIKDAGLNTLTHYFTRPVKSQTAWRQVLGRLQLIRALLDKLEMNKNSTSGFEIDAVMAFLSSAFTSANAEVRGAAVKLAVQVHDLTGCNMQRYLPSDLNPKLKEQLDAALSSTAQPQKRGIASGARSASPSVVQTHVKTTSNLQGAKPKRTSHYLSSVPNHPSKENIRDPKEKEARRDKPLIHVHVTAEVGRHKVSNGTTQHDAYPLSKIQDSHEPAVPSGVHNGLLNHEITPDDPALYEAELRSKEQRFGPNHPQVASALANLAILFNQKNEFIKAQPLYERALRIFESNYGPDHPEVAHTLTDLAVLHLERGNESMGRPLLERALKIQETALGPNHPDVVAIREVLESDDESFAS